MPLRYMDRQRYAPAVYVPGYTEPFWATPQHFIDKAESLDLPILRPPHPGRIPGLSMQRDLLNTRALFRRADVDVVHIHTNHPNGARKVTVAARMAGVPTVVRSEHLPPTHLG